MRKVKYMVAASLDGYVASPDGSVDWLERAKGKAKGEDYGMGEFFKSIDTMLMGRKTYEQALAMGAGRPISPGMRNISFSRTLPAGQRDGMEFVQDFPSKLIARLKQERGKDIWLCGRRRVGARCDESQGARRDQHQRSTYPRGRRSTDVST